jgi:hypothetical protein
VAGKSRTRRCRERSGPKGPLPLGDTVHRQRPNTCVTASGKRTTDRAIGFTTTDSCRPRVRKRRLSSKLTKPEGIKAAMTFACRK